MLLDDVYRLWPVPAMRHLLDVIAPRLQVLRIQNVADFYWQHDQDLWTEKDFPNVAPPWPFFWAEYRFPKIMRAEHRSGRSPTPGMLIGALCQSFKAEGVRNSTLVAPSDPLANFFVQGEVLAREHPEAYWLSTTYIFIGNGRDRVDLLLAMIRAIDAEGHLIEAPTPTLCGPGPAGLVKERGEEVVANLVCYTDAFHLALCFCHCKNVVRVIDPISAPLAKKRTATGKFPLRETITLRIEPMQRILRESAGSETGLTVRMHICRGHFKEYRGDHKLFGRHEGVWWWGEQVRGSRQRGVVDKVYDVHPPRRDSQEE